MSAYQQSNQLPWLLYSYPWMPFPRRIAGYLSEKRILSSVIKIIQVSDPQLGDAVVEHQAASIPPRPEGSLPILAIPPQASNENWTYIRQSMAIITYLEEAMMPGGSLSHVDSRALSTSQTTLERARDIELQTLAEELLITWNPVRSFGTKAGTMEYPEGAKEMLRWVHRTLANVDRLLGERDLDVLKHDEAGTASIADIVLFHFMDFIDVCYGVDLTQGSGQTTTDVYGRIVKEEYINLRKFYENFKDRDSARRNTEIGEYPGEMALKAMSTWYDGVL